MNREAMKKESDELTSASSEPIRTCIATSTRKPQSQLLRVVLDPEDPTKLVADPRKSVGGRGAWITPTIDALELAEKRRAFARALRVSAHVDTGHVRSYLQSISATQTRE